MITFKKKKMESVFACNFVPLEYLLAKFCTEVKWSEIEGEHA